MGKNHFLVAGLGLGLALLSIVISVSGTPFSILPSLNVEPGDFKPPKAKLTSLGGLSKAESADEHVQELVEKLKADIYREACKKLGLEADDEKCGKTDHKLEAVEFKSQVVAGTNYFVKVKCLKADKIWHTKIFEQPWTNTLELIGLAGPKEDIDDIEFF